MDNTCKFVLELDRKANLKTDSHRDAVDEITKNVITLINKFIQDDRTGFNLVSPTTLITVIVNNIMINLFMCSLQNEELIKNKLEMAQDFIDETRYVFMSCIEKMIMIESDAIGGKH